MRAIITDLVFEHALRIRVKAGTTEVDSNDVRQEASEDTFVESPDSHDDAAANANVSTAQTKGKRKEPSADAAKADRAEGSAHLIGKINNLVSGDLQNMSDLSMLLIFWSTFSHFGCMFTRDVHSCALPIQWLRCRPMSSSAPSSFIGSSA